MSAFIAQVIRRENLLLFTWMLQWYYTWNWIYMESYKDICASFASLIFNIHNEYSQNIVHVTVQA